jgi:hypothetical protein
MNVKHLGLIVLTAAVAAGLAGMSTSNAGAAVAPSAAPSAVATPAAATANCVIRTYNGNYVTAVGGGGRNTDTLHTDATRIGAWEKFALVPLGNGMTAIQTVDGHYLTAMSGGGWNDNAINNPAFHTDATRIQAWEEFTLVPLNNGKPFGYAIRTVGGYYLTAVDGGGRNTVVMDDLIDRVQNWEQFQIICGL